eukprot:15338884-Ditylum_brightwellii.AAC.1
MLEEAKFRLKTALGVSDEYYTHCCMYPIYRSGQGATNNPQIWLAISSTMCGICKECAQGAEFVSPNQAVSVLLAILGFVDDVTNQVNMFQDNIVTVDKLINDMKRDSQLWDMLLWLTGGLLELQKCSYHTIHFNFKSDGTPQLQTLPPTYPLLIKHAHQNEHVTIKYKLVYNPHKTLGHYKAPAGTGQVQGGILAEKAEKYARKVLKSALTKYEAWVFYTSCYLKSIGYVLGQTFFSKHVLETINHPAICTFSSKCGCNQNMA